MNGDLKGYINVMVVVCYLIFVFVFVFLFVFFFFVFFFFCLVYPVCMHERCSRRERNR